MKKFSWEYFSQNFGIIPQIFMQQLLCTRKLLGDSNRKKFPSFYLYYSSERQIIIKCKSKMLLFSLSILFNSF